MECSLKQKRLAFPRTDEASGVLCRVVSVLAMQDILGGLERIPQL